jgi:hypothetical protein
MMLGGIFGHIYSRLFFVRRVCTLVCAVTSLSIRDAALIHPRDVSEHDEAPGDWGVCHRGHLWDVGLAGVG